MGNLLQMSITSGQDTDSRQFTLAASSHRLAGETYDANGNRTSGSADGFTSVSYNILNLPETVTAGGWTINYLYSAAGAKLRERVILSASEESTTDYAGNTVFRDSVLHKVLTGSGYLETTDSLQTLLSHPGYRFFITDHLGSVRVVADSQGNVLQRNVFHPYGEDYAAVYAQGGNILDGLNIGSNAQPGGEGTPEGEGEPAIDDPEPGTPVGGGGPDGPIEDDGEEATADEAPLAWPQYYRSFNPYRFSAKEQMTVYGGSLVGSNFEPNVGLYDFGARWYAPYSARWSTPDPLSEKYYSISPYAYCAGNPVNLVDPTGMDWYTNNETGYYTWFEGNEEREGYTYYGAKGSILGDAEDILDHMNKLYGSHVSIFSDSFSFAVRENDVLTISGGKNRLGLFGEFLFNVGPEFSVFLADHPLTQDMANTSFVKWMQRIILASKKDYIDYHRDWGLLDVMSTSSEAEQFIGSYRYIALKSRVDKCLYNVIYDSKSRTSLFYHLPRIKNVSREDSILFGNTYQFYIWKSHTLKY